MKKKGDRTTKREEKKKKKTECQGELDIKMA